MLHGSIAISYADTRTMDIPELLNLQDVGGKDKPYQVRQLPKLVERHNLAIGEVP
jgi:hypothetical protein